MTDDYIVLLVHTTSVLNKYYAQRMNLKEDTKLRVKAFNELLPYNERIDTISILLSDNYCDARDALNNLEDIVYLKKLNTYVKQLIK